MGKNGSAYKAVISRLFANNVCRLFILVVAALVLCSCSSGHNVSKAEEQIPHFRQQMAAQQFDQIYTETGDELKKATTKQDFVNLLGAVEGKLGGVKETTKNGWNVNFQPSGTFVVLGFKTQFEKGAGEETFTYRISDRDALLVGYRINSNTLITN